MIVINQDNLLDEEVDVISEKARAILIDINNNILIAYYGNVILLPGGSRDEDEPINLTIERELAEETGQTYPSDELNLFVTVNHYQRNYPKRDGTYQNRLVKTHYFLGEYKGHSNQKQQLTEKEQKDGFKLELIPLANIEEIILSNQNTNPRNSYFSQELLMVINAYKNKYGNFIPKKKTYK